MGMTSPCPWGFGDNQTPEGFPVTLGGKGGDEREAMTWAVL
jgi:hypothetical protein